MLNVTLLDIETYNYMSETFFCNNPRVFLQENGLLQLIVQFRYFVVENLIKGLF